MPLFEETYAKAKDNCYGDYSFHMLVSNPTQQAISDLPALKEAGVTSIKIYMTYAALQLRDDQVLDVLLASRQNGITTMVHAENVQRSPHMSRSKLTSAGGCLELDDETA